jgi:AraC-like DNA-binding protein/DNA-binding MarR family transcriptional regulator
MRLKILLCSVAVDTRGKTVEIDTPKLWLIFSRTHSAILGFLKGGITLHGISFSDFLILEALLHNESLGWEALNQKLRDLDNVTVNGSIDSLERRGLIMQRRDARGVWNVKLTKRGHGVITKAYTQHVKDIDAALGSLTTEERIYLYERLKKIGLYGEKLQNTRFKGQRGGLAPWQLRKATDYMAQHLTKSVPLAKIAAQTKLSESQLRRAFKVSTGIPPHRWHLNIRIAKAQELLRDGALPMREIALATGFVALSHFSRSFRKIVGVSPSEWQRHPRQ